MSNFYVNFSVKGVTQAKVAEVLQHAKLRAIVTPSQSGYVVVYEEQADKQAVVPIQQTGILLSRELKQPAFASLVHDDEVFSYWLFESGKVTDSYTSTLPAAERGGDATKLCAVLNSNASAVDVEDILRTEDVEGAAVYLHMQLTQTLALPSWSVGLGYGDVQDGHAREVMDVKKLVHVNK